MASAKARLLEEALQLPPDQRAELAGDLLAEIERRARAAMAGSPGVSWSEARAQIQSRLRPR